MLVSVACAVTIPGLPDTFTPASFSAMVNKVPAKRDGLESA